MQELDTTTSGLADQVLPSQERLCISCIRPIHTDAKRCHNCGAFQTWIRHFVTIGVVVAVIIPVISIILTLINAHASQDSAASATKEAELAQAAAAKASEALAQVELVSDNLLRVRADGADRRLALFLDNFWKDFNESRGFCERGNHDECILRTVLMLDEIQEVLLAILEGNEFGDRDFAAKSKEKVCRGLEYYTSKLGERGYTASTEIQQFTKIACKVPLGKLTRAQISEVYQ